MSFAKSECENTYNIAAVRAWPVSFRDKNGKVVGVGHDISRALGASTGCRVIVDEVPSYRSWRALKDDRYEMTLINIENSGEFGSYGIFIPVTKIRRVLVINPLIFHKEWSIQDYIDAPKIRFSGIISMSYAYKKDEIDELLKQRLYIETTDYETMLKLIQNGKADATFLPEPTYEYFKKNTKLVEGLTTIQDNNTWVNSGIYTSKKRVSGKDLAIIRNAVAVLSSSGDLKKIFAKYGISEPEILIATPAEIKAETNSSMK